MFERHKTLQRYVISEYLRIFGLSLSSLTLMYVVVLFFQKVKLFVKFDAPVILIFEYLLYKIAEVTFQWTLPYGVLVGTLLTLGMFSRNSEITAMKAGGVSLYRITFPLFFIALFFSLASFIGNEYLVPFTNQSTKYLLDVKVRKEPATSVFKNYKIWYHGDHRIYNIQLLDGEKKTLNGVTLYQFDEEFRCIQRIDAQEARWVDDKWKFFNGWTREFSKDGSMKAVAFKEMDIPLEESWDILGKIERQSEDMSYTELATYIEKIRAAGYDSTRYLADLHAKLSYPLLNLVMVLIGIPFALKTSRSGGIALNIGLSMMLGFLYGVVFYVFLSFGRSGVLPPLVAAWTPTFLFGLAGVFTLMSIRQ